jgi:hypothetical protein
MDFMTETRMQASWTLGFQPDGRELLVVAVKGTFSIPHGDEEASLAETQIPLTESDEFTGEPGLSATRYESDYAHRKPLCDILLNGSAYAPGGRPAERVTVTLRVGTMSKSFDVIGERVWEKRLFSVRPSRPKPFVQLPITYDRAFGGVDADEKKPDRRDTYLKNPVGVGYYPLTKRNALIGKSLPNTEEIGRPVKATTGTYQPMSFGAIGRNFESRIPFAGTYDQKWLDNRAPFWPNDFDYMYFQATPRDQQIPHPRGGEEVVLQNLTPQGITKFRLPSLQVPVLFIPHQGEDHELVSVIDTVLIEPDQSRFMLTWRISLPLRHNCFELRQVIVGEMSRSWRIKRRAERAGKRYYEGLAQFIRDKKQALLR